VGRACPERSEGIQQFRNRAYDPATGTWIQKDPMGVAGGVNLCRFNNGNPVSFGDPLGLCPVCLLGAAGAAIGGVGQVASNLLNDRPVLQGVGQAVGVGAAAGLTLGLAAPAITASVLGGGAARVAASAAGSLADDVAAATGGTVRALARGQGSRVTVSTGGRNVVARIKPNGDFRVSIEGLGSMTREGVLSSDAALTHLTSATADDVILLINRAAQITNATKP